MENCKEKIGDEEEVEITDNVEFSGIPESWTQESITVTISHPNIPEGYEIQYKIGEGEWTTGESVVIEQNGIIYGRLYNGTTDDAAAENSKNITNIDKTAPTVPTEIESSVTTNSITVTASGGTDSISGVVGYQYRINSGAWSGTIANGTSHTFSGLTAGTNYTIVARTVDNAGRTSNNYTKTLKTTDIKITSITLHNIIIEVGSTEIPIETIIEPSNATNKTLKWSSNYPNMLSVDSNGVITSANISGTFIITAIAQDGSGVQATCMVNVTNVPSRWRWRIMPEMEEWKTRRLEYIYLFVLYRCILL